MLNDGKDILLSSSDQAHASVREERFECEEAAAFDSLHMKQCFQ